MLRSSRIRKLEDISRQNRLKIEYTVQEGSVGNLIPIDIFKILFPKETMEHLAKDKRVILCTYNENRQLFLKLHGAKSFSTLDIRSGYLNITVAEDSRKYKVFTTEYGTYEFVQIPFGFHIAPSTLH